jgi:rod shape-determining protein MreD
MNWLVFVISALLALALDKGLATLWHLGHVVPSPVLVLAIFIAVAAPPRVSLWAALLLGVLLDLTSPYPRPGSPTDLVIMGPTALGFFAGAYLVLQLRAMVFRHTPLSLGVLTFAAGILAHLVTVALLTFRGLPLMGGGIPGFDAADQLLLRFLGILYTSVLALPLGWLLFRYRRWWHFVPGPARGGGIRRMG